MLPSTASRPCSRRTASWWRALTTPGPGHWPSAPWPAATPAWCFTEPPTTPPSGCTTRDLAGWGSRRRRARSASNCRFRAGTTHSTLPPPSPWRSNSASRPTPLRRHWPTSPAPRAVSSSRGRAAASASTTTMPTTPRKSAPPCPRHVPSPGSTRCTCSSSRTCFPGPANLPASSPKRSTRRTRPWSWTSILPARIPFQGSPAG